MHPNPSRLLALVAGSALFVIPSLRPAHAADTCGPGDLYEDVQPAFTAAGFDQLQQVTLTPQKTLRSVNPFWTPTSVDSIVFPSDQNVTISFVYESAGASHALGYVYMSDLRARGYVNAQGDLVDANGNGIADLHEDLYNLAPPSGAQARPYIGVSPRCSRTFVSRGFTYRQPDLALNSACASAFITNRDMTDARPGRTSSAYNITVDVVGSTPPSAAGTGYSDNGLFTRIPNLLEPAHASNNNMGIGHLAFLLADDDSDRETFQGLGTVADATDVNDGVPDYDVSAYDGHGLPRTSNPDPGITPYDRTVDLGVIAGGQEVIFFLVSAYETQHNTDNGTVFPCLSRDANLKCTLHLKTPLNVFFSKAKWNLDQDFMGQNPVVSRNMGCDYRDACNAANPASSPYACTLAGTTQKLCGWLDDWTRERLATMPYGNTSLPMAATTVAAPGNLVMPHAVLSNVGPASDRWLLAFEDLPGGGDRDFNDVVFMLRNWAPTSGRVRSTVLSPAAPSCAIQQVYIHKDDAQDPTCSSPVAIHYAVATDCRVCLASTCVPNPTPTWHPVTFDWNRDAVLDVSGTPGHQLCWKADLIAGNGPCQATINNVDIGYESGPVNP
ncbi:DUF4114 domain-containing protein [Corallococcus exiguus]|uniref:DUF4114 domain-containing protein n=1 Tax=Corallococcus exiguus TaxID=83462 RepID=A0A7X4Y560_9BACT|nr:DUF4114 domain-containing protein [Corallococcus exiguus]NBC38815.1 DUF4114 domain-containing protein [Corallococcus exiguus]TNV61548.1 DUF4114 domain-containing protein [Corallococcus exiguus]